MSKKAILITTQSVRSSSIIAAKPSGFVSLNFDNCRMNIDAYSDAFREAQPREKCLITLADKREVFEFDSELLFEMVRYFRAYHPGHERVVNYKNRFHYIVEESSKD